MVCPKCGMELRGKRSTCRYCGAAVPSELGGDRPDPIFDNDYDWLRAQRNDDTETDAEAEGTQRRSQNGKAVSKEKEGIRRSTIILLSMAAAVLLVLALLLMLYMRWGIDAELHDGSETDRPVYGELDIGGQEETGGIDFTPVATNIPAGSSEPLSPDEPETEAPTPTPAPTPSPAPTPTPSPLLSTGEYILPDSDERYLSRDDLAGLTQEQCCLARNEIYARHGRIFRTAAIARYFSAKSWYSATVPAEDFSDSVLNRYEIANIDFISDYENEKWGGSYY